jgi:hypothetical protein
MDSELIEPNPHGPEEAVLIFVRAADELSLWAPDYQKELAEFAKGLRAEGITIHSQHFAMDAVDAGGGLTGEFNLLLKAFGPVVGIAIGAFLKGRYGRKVRLKIGKGGEIAAEAQTVEEVNELIKIAREHPKPQAKRVAIDKH